MRVALIVLIAVLFPSCGGNETPVPSSTDRPAASKKANAPPILATPQVLPSEPRSNQDLSASIKVHDPDGDPLRIEVAWYRNGVPHRAGESTTLPASDISRGDEIHAIVHVSDGEVTVSTRSESVRVQNQVPIIHSVELLPKGATAKDELLVVPKASDPDKDRIEFSYHWYVNGKELRGVSGGELEAGRVRYGDEVVVSVSGSDSHGESDPVQSPPLHIGNSAPQITSKPTYSLSGRNEYQYQVVAVDPDGNRLLSFELHKAPPGMTIGLVSGLVSWIVPDDADGKYPVELSVSDADGGQTRQSYVLELRWATPPADTP